MDRFVGRERETKELQECLTSSQSEFVVVYGRRRVGKTFLIRHFFKDKYTFYYVGAHGNNKNMQLSHFRTALSDYSGNKVEKIKSWTEAFKKLEEYLEQLPDKKKVVFIDEMPWIDTKRSEFVSSLEYFWNSWVAKRDDIILVACGSATAWMADKIVENRGGLRGRITRRIYLHPFTLHECREFLRSRGFDWDEYQIMQIYMIFGGVPYYLNLLKPDLSLQQNVDALLFSASGLLKDEFYELYNSLFNKADKYIMIVKLLSKHKEGLGRNELQKQLGLSGGTFTKILKNLERCDFIVGYNQLGNKKKGTLYRLIDFFTLFYYKFIESNNTKDEQYWMHNFQTRAVEVWEGHSFELLCLRHLQQIKMALGISGISTTAAAWRSRAGKDAKEKNKKGAQVDLVIKRVDKITHLCEMKFSEKEYTITADYEKKLKQRLEIFCEQTGIQRGVVHTFITPAGVKKGIHYSLVHSEVTVKGLFAE